MFPVEVTLTPETVDEFVPIDVLETLSAPLFTSYAPRLRSVEFKVTLLVMSIPVEEAKYKE